VSNNIAEQLQAKLDPESYEKLAQFQNPMLHQFVLDTIELCTPDSVFVCTDTDEDIDYCRQLAADLGEEKTLATDGHTIHYDGPKDQARDKENTKYLVPAGAEFGKNLNQRDKEGGVAEVRGFFKGSMKGRQALVRFLCLGPVGSEFSIACCQITDSAYVAHSESLLYRPGYENFKTIGDSTDFFRVLHSSGKVDERMCSVDVDKRRIYIDYEDQLVYSINTQYAGNTVGFKKLSLRLAIRKAAREGWLAEHMFLLGVNGPGGRLTYFSGAYPSMCGKTSTAMLKNEKIVGDDLAYLRERDGKVYAANVESGLFGIIQDVNPEDDPEIWNVITAPGEVIFSNVLVADRVPYWLGDGREPPEEGESYCVKWTKDLKDADGKPVPHAHKNARYTIRQSDLANCDPAFEAPAGVPLSGIIYGGRDSDTSVPCEQTFDWAHGVITKGASLESETTAATLGQEGVRAFQPMSNIDFLSMPIGEYVQMHLEFEKDVAEPPTIFAVNYFQRDETGKFLTGMHDKRVWIKWMERRLHGEVEVIEGPTGLIPKYEDLKQLFQEVLGDDYTEEQYVEQFMCRVQANLDKIERIKALYAKDPATPQVLFDVLDAQRERLEKLKDEKGESVSPYDL